MAELGALRKGYWAVVSGEGAHLSDNQWERLACGEMDPSEKESALDHIMSCAECSKVYRGILAVTMEARSFDAGAPHRRIPAGRTHQWRWRGFVAGLAAAAVAVVAVLLVHPLAQPGTVKTGTPQATTLRATGSAAGPQLVSPVGSLREIPTELSWRPVEGARGYVVELLDGEGELLWRSKELTAAHVPWPSSVIRVSGRYYWRVLAIPEDGGEPRASKLEAFDVGVTSSPR